MQQTQCDPAGGPGLPADWLDYGDIDPLDNPGALLHSCRQCGGAPSLGAGPLNSYGRPTLRAMCACGRRGPTSDVGYGAVLAWNMRPDLAATPDYRELPFFDLADLAPEVARQKLVLLKAHLASRIDTAKRRVESGMGCGRQYRHRLQAYMGWCVHSLKCVERAPRWFHQ